MFSKCYRSRQRPDRSQSSWLSEDIRTHEIVIESRYRKGTPPYQSVPSGNVASQPNPPSFISKFSKTAGQRYIDTPGTVYLEVFVDSPQGCIVLSFSFAGAEAQKTKEPADT